MTTDQCNENLNTKTMPVVNTTTPIQ